MWLMKIADHVRWPATSSHADGAAGPVTAGSCDDWTLVSGINVGSSTDLCDVSTACRMIPCIRHTASKLAASSSLASYKLPCSPVAGRAFYHYRAAASA